MSNSHVHSRNWRPKCYFLNATEFQTFFIVWRGGNGTWEVNLFKNVFEWKFQHLEIAPKLGMGNRPASIAYFFHISNNAGKVIWKFSGSKLAKKCFFSHRNRLWLRKERSFLLFETSLYYIVYCYIYSLTFLCEFMA